MYQKACQCKNAVATVGGLQLEAIGDTVILRTVSNQPVCNACGKAWLPKLVPEPRLKHLGVSAYRLNKNCDNPREVAFALAWQEENTPFHSGGDPLIRTLLAGKCVQRDAEVAATVIQWLGSNVGMAFLEKVLTSDPSFEKFRSHIAIKATKKGAKA